MRFLLDANVAPALQRALYAAGYDVAHATSFLPANANDPEVDALANRLNAVLITKDSDFLDLKARGLLEGALVLLRTGNMMNKAVGQILVPALSSVVAAIAVGEAIIEIRQ